VKVSPKLDFGDTSPGISPDNIKIFTERDGINLNSGTVKAVIEVMVGEPIVTAKHPNKPDKKGDKNSAKIKILLCDREGDCKIHEIKIDGNDSDEEEDASKKKLKPVIVTDFNEDPLKGIEKGDGSDQEYGKKAYDVPVIVGYQGAVKDDNFYYRGYDSGQSIDRLPSYYGMKLSPGFYQTYPGASTYENVPHVSPRADFNHGSYRPIYTHNSDFPCVYPQYEHCAYLQHQRHYPDYVAARQYERTSFPGYGPRTPSPYGKFHPTRNPDSFHAIITPIGRSENIPTVYRPVNKPTEPGVLALHGKMDFDEDKVPVWGTDPLYPTSGHGNIKVDGKLGEPLSKSDS
jgi:hypothetical protein